MQRLLALLVCCVPTLAAQEVATIGTFSTPDGAPIANATVTFATSPPDVFDLFAPPRLVEATTDAAGKWKVKLRQGAAHSAWALGPAGEGGRWRSAVREGVVAGNVVEMVAEKERTAAKPIRFVPTPELGSGPFTLEVRSPALHGPAHRLPLPADGTLALPELPAGRAVLRLLRADGSVAVGWFWPLGERTQTAPVRRCAVRVTDEAGKPVAGVHVAACVSAFLGVGNVFHGSRTIDSCLQAPLTDADGMTTVVAAEHHLSGFVAWTADRHARVARRHPQAIVDGELQPGTQDLPGDEVPIQLILRRGPVLAGRIANGTQPLAGIGVVADVQVVCRWTDGGSSATTGFHTTHTARTDADGRFVLPDVVRPIGSLRLAFDNRDDVRTLSLPRAAVPNEPLSFDLATWPVLTLRFPAAGPTPTATRFLLWPADPEHEGSPVVLVGERSGRAKVRLEPGAWFLFATDGERHAAQILDVRSGISPEIDLQAAALGEMSGHLLDGAGKPLPGVGFVCNGTRGTNTATTAVGRLLARHVSPINAGLVGLAQSDGQGAYTVRFLDLPGLVPVGYVNGALGALEFDFRQAVDRDIVWRK
ncbi:MAG: hypothetical protein JNK15_13395 [Planctomycetes bacterium]|nr:hypothetical protein [Planctomycetota bacterium]